MWENMHLPRAARWILIMVLALSLSANHVPFGVESSAAADETARIVKEPISYEYVGYVGLSKSMAGKSLLSCLNAPSGPAVLLIPVIGTGLLPVLLLRSRLSQLLRRFLLTNIQFSANYL
jgi:hypothetical protein